MTHEELLYRVNWASERYHDTDGRAQYFNALRAIVELHKPRIIQGSGWSMEVCRGCDIHTYEGLCPTIQAIEKELEINSGSHQ